MASISNNQEPANKVQKILNKNDRISSLPDSLLIHILSFLPTKYAVGTSILSSRWKHLWASVPILDFDSKLRFELVEPNSDVSSSNFLNFVERVLFNHELSCIQKFRLYCDGDEDSELSRIYTWIGVAIKRGVQELDINIYTPGKIYLPPCLFTCPTLVVLKVGHLVSFSVPCSVHFKSLKVLHISVGPLNDLTRNLFHNCPVLEDLIIEGALPSGERLFFDISTPALKRLKLDFYIQESEDSWDEIVVNAPILEYLFVQDYWSTYALKNLTSLVKADVNVGDYWDGDILASKRYADSVFVLLRNLFSVKHLSLGALTMEAFDYADDDELPIFSNLIRLELNVDNCRGWKRLLHLLNSMPNLVYLVLKKLKTNIHCQHNDSKDFKFVEPEVPCCLSIHLQEIEITGFLGRSCDLEQKLIQYFMGNAKVLRKMTINSCNSE